MNAAVEEMLKTSDTLDRNRRTIELMSALTVENLPGAIEAYEKDLARVDSHEGRLFANAWARLDPQGAVERMLDWRYPKVTFQSVEEAVIVWTRLDPAAARDFVDPSIGSPDMHGRKPTKFMVLAVVKSLGIAGEEEELTEFLETIEDEGNLQFFLNEVMIEMNRVHGLETTKAWVDQIPWEADRNLKVLALTKGLDWTSQLDGRIAAKWYEEIEEDPRSLQLLPTTVAGWSVRRPEEAILWLAERPPSKPRNQLIRHSALGWLNRKTEVAEPWLLEKLDDERLRDSILMPLISLRVKQARYDEAIAFARQLPDERERDYALAVTLAEWSRLDEAAVEAYIEEARVSDAVVANMRDQLKGRVKVKRRSIKDILSDREGGEG